MAIRELEITRGGKGKKAPYVSTHVRVPEPIKHIVDKLVNGYKTAVTANAEGEFISSTEKALESDNSENEVELQATIPDLSKLKRYKLHGRDVVRVEDLVALLGEHFGEQ